MESKRAHFDRVLLWKTMKKTMNHIAECGDLPTLRCEKQKQDHSAVFFSLRSLSQLNVLNKMNNQRAH